MIVRTVAELRDVRRPARSAGLAVRLVPTMGYLHDGHLSLIDRARRDGGHVVVSVFVNPTQFGDPADLASYPRDEQGDVKLATGAGADVVFGHSSHHPRPIEVYRGKLVLYGCGDLIDDYEGITGYDEYRDDLRLLYLATIDAESGDLSALQMFPFQARQMRLHRASARDTDWLAGNLGRISRRFGSQVLLDPDGSLVLEAV